MVNIIHQYIFFLHTHGCMLIITMGTVINLCVYGRSFMRPVNRRNKVNSDSIVCGHIHVV